ncbi:MAG: hypothetical protein L0Z47_00770 [Actinobacteria bacterium]|nr:hypothetical protein [Actinomycetota bacterium]
MIAVLGFTLAYTAALFVYGQAVESPLTTLYTEVNVGLLVLFGVLNNWARWPLRALWAVSLVGLGNMVGGVLLVSDQPLYMTAVAGPVLYDKVFHAVAAAAMTVIAWEAMKRWAGTGGHYGGTLLLTWLVVMGGGAVVEIAEFIGSNLGDVSVGDYTNNALDLVANAIGATVGLALLVWWERDANLR